LGIIQLNSLIDVARYTDKYYDEPAENALFNYIKKDSGLFPDEVLGRKPKKFEDVGDPSKKRKAEAEEEKKSKCKSFNGID
jgi:hypothetical protein